jgi:hypothetical protein
MALLCATAPGIYAQSSYPVETVGTPASPCLAWSYSGWSNSQLTYSGNGQVENSNSSNNPGASGGGNIFFPSAVGTFLKISGFNPTSPPVSMDITFSMFGYNTTNLTELTLEYTTDGVNYTALPYKRLFRNYLPATPWDVMVSDPLPGSVNFNTLQLRFRQTTLTETFRIDDIEANFYYTLPIKLISFSAAATNSGTQIKWKANATHEQEKFVVEKSLDGRNFAPISTQMAHVGEFNYAYIDKATADKTFYRLKMTDVSGRSNYSQAVFVQTKNTSTGLVQNVYPIPANDVINTQLLASTQQTAEITVSDLSGRTVLSQSYALMAGSNNCVLNIAKMNAGIYILRIRSGEVLETRKVVIQ